MAKIIKTKKTSASKTKAKVKKPVIKKTAKIKTVKKIIKKPIKKLVIRKIIKEKKIGKVLHYFDKIKVVAIKLKDNLEVGDTIRIKGGKETDFKQKITSMEIDGQKIKKAKKNQGIGFKVKEKARPGYWVYKI